MDRKLPSSEARKSELYDGFRTGGKRGLESMEWAVDIGRWVGCGEVEWFDSSR
jgi:hypothetical protein